MTHYTSEMYGELEYARQVETIAGADGEPHEVVRTIWNDGGQTITPSEDQAARGIIAIMPDIFNTQEHHEIMTGETCPMGVR